MRYWADNMKLIRELWPRTKFTDKQWAIWERDLKPLDQDILGEAIQSVYSSGDFCSLKSIKARYDARKQARQMHQSACEHGSPVHESRKRREQCEAEKARMVSDLRQLHDLDIEAARWHIGRRPCAVGMLESDRNRSADPHDWSMAFISLMHASACGPGFAAIRSEFNGHAAEAAMRAVSDA